MIQFCRVAADGLSFFGISSVRASSSVATSAVSAAPFRWKSSSACRSLFSASAAADG
jgi:hypothetical protein